MHKLMCTFVATTKKIPDQNLDTSCPAGIPCNDPNEYFFLPIVYSKNTNVCQFMLMIDHFE